MQIQRVKHCRDTIRRLERDCVYAQTRFETLLSPERRAEVYI